MSTRGTFVIPVHDLDTTGRDVRFDIATSWVRGALEECELQPAGPDGSMALHLTKNGNDVLVQGQIDVELAIPCARCLKPVSMRPHIELSLLLAQIAAPLAPGRRAPRRPPPPSDGETDFAAEDADIDTYEGDEVVLDRFVREAILLESPIFPLCSEACEGIRPASETTPSPEGVPTDPRLLPLLELAKRRNMKE